MKKLRILSATLCVSMLVSAFGLLGAAASFPDVEDDPTVSWARDAINDMADAGYIKGYEDGTFQPNRAVSKVETLLLMSRILGVDEDEFADYSNWADLAYSNTVRAINSTYVSELSYLMYFGVIDISDLRTYASTAAANTSLLRWQAAYLITKLLGQTEEAADLTLAASDYSDYESVPETARPYVAFVTQEGLMNGMGNDEDGNATFSPETTLTRSQMAMLLSRLIDKMDKHIESGTAVEIGTDYIGVDIDGSTVDIDYSESLKVVSESTEIGFDSIVEDSAVDIVYVYGDAMLINVGDAVDSANQTVYGVISQKNDNANGLTLTIYDHEDESNTATYTISRNCAYTVSGTTAGFGDLKIGNFVRCILSGGEIVEIHVEDKTSTVSGVFRELEFDNENHTYITITEDESGDDIEYVVSTNGARVTRNGSSITLRELADGDEVTLTLDYGKVSRVEASSTSGTARGTIKEIILSDAPKITMEIEGEEYTYSMTTNTEVTVNGVAGTIYDLRPNNSADIVIDGTTVTSIDTSATSSSGRTTIEGRVTGINTSIYVISVENSNGGTDTVYYNSSTTIIDNETGKTMSARDITSGDTVTATGNDSTGYFVATVIVVM